jgi:hypothetical protein
LKESKQDRANRLPEVLKGIAHEVTSSFWAGTFVIALSDIVSQ